MRALTSSLAALAIASSVPAFSEDAKPVQDNYIHRVGFLIEYLPIDSEVAKVAGVGEQAVSVGAFYGGQFFKYGVFNVGLAAMFINDNDEFSQTVERNIGGDRETRDSEISAGSVFAEIGGQYGFFEKENLILGLVGGYRINDVKRSIPNCVDCSKQDLGDFFKSSPYVKPYVGFNFTDGFGVSLSYSVFTEDKTFDNSASLAFNWMF